MQLLFDKNQKSSYARHMLNDETMRQSAHETTGGPAAARTMTVGLVGAGFMGRVHALAARSAGARVAGVVASSAARAADAQATVSAEQVFTSLPDLLALSGLDAVHVCVPNHLHFETALAVIEAGKHVICEKPLAVSVEQATTLVDAAAAAGVTTGVPFVYRFHPMVREMRNRVRAGNAGAIGLVHGSYLQDWLASADDYNWRIDARSGGISRTFADIGSHWFDLLEFVTGDPVAAVSAQFSTLRPTRAVPGGGTTAVVTEDSVTVQFRTQGGVIGSFSAAQVAAGRKNRLLLEVSGSETSYSFDQETPEELWAGDALGHRILVRDPATLSDGASEYAVLPSGHAQGYQDCFNSFVRDSYTAMRGGNPEGRPDFEAGLRSAFIVDAVVQSQAEGSRWVDVGATQAVHA